MYNPSLCNYVGVLSVSSKYVCILNVSSLLYGAMPLYSACFFLFYIFAIRIGVSPQHGSSIISFFLFDGGGGVLARIAFQIYITGDGIDAGRTKSHPLSSRHYFVLGGAFSDSGIGLTVSELWALLKSAAQPR